MNKSYCNLGLNGVAVLGYGKVKPCCRFVSNRDLKYIHDMNLKDVYYDETYVDIRQKMINGERIAGCEPCYAEERNGLVSLRMNTYKDFNENKNTLKYLEIGLTNVCDLKCVTCCSDLSTSWKKDDATLLKYKNDMFERDLPNDHKSLDVNQINLKDFPDLSYLKLLGGELFIDPKFKKFLKSIPKDIIGNINLEFYTNCSTFPDDEVISLLQEFKSLNLYVSIDAYDKKNEYLRKNSIWKNTENVVKKWLLLKQSTPQLSIRTISSISAYGVLYVNELIEWWYRVNGSYDNHLIKIIRHPSYLSPGVLPKEIIEKSISLLEKYDNKRVIDFKNMLKGIKYTKPDVFIEYVNKLDEIRGTSFSSTFPELKEMMNEYI